MKEELIQAGMKYMVQLDEFKPSNVYRQVELELEEILALNEEAVLEKRLKYVGVGKKEDYLNRWIETSQGFVLAGIRHMGGNLEEAFVFFWPTFHVQEEKKLAVELAAHFSSFQPKSCIYWSRPDRGCQDAQVIQQRFIGRISQMEKMNLELVEPKDYYDWYSEEYRKFHAKNPDMAHRITVNEKELMDHCLEQGLLFYLMEDDQRIGLIAGEWVEFLQQKTVYLDEILIAEAYRGQGYAAKLLGSFIKLLDVKFLICHIDSENVASTKTAIRSGQRVFSRECKITLN